MSNTTEEFVTAERAKEYLARNHPRNRTVLRGKVEKMKQDLLEGRHVPTHQGIAFDLDGNLVDGQHRLTAIAESGVGIRLLVTRGLGPEAFDVIDTGRVRKDFERLYMSGRDIHKDDSAMIKFAIGSGSLGQHVKYHDIGTAFDRLQDGITFVTEHAPARKVPTPIRAAILRAFYNVDRNRLVEFCNVVVSSEVSSNGDGAAVALVRMVAKYDYGGMSSRRQLYMVAERAIGHFLQFTTPGILKPVTSEQFPLPWEKHEQNGKVD